MLVLLSSLVASLAQPKAPPQQRPLAERFVALATPEKALPMDAARNFMAEALVKENPGREADARRVADEAHQCLIGHRGNAAMRQAAVEAALKFGDEQLQRLIAFVEMRRAQRRAGASNRIPPGWETARKDYGKWMYSIPAQPSVIALMNRCDAETMKRIAAAGLRN